MSTSTTAPAISRSRPAEPTAKVGFGAILSSEWAKIRTVRSTFWTMILMVVGSIGLTALVCFLAAPDVASGAESESPGSFINWGLNFGQIAALVLGILAMSAEYSTGMVRTTLTAAPRRMQVLAAKAIVLAGLLFVLGVVTSAGSYFAGNVFLDAEGIGLSLSDDGILRSFLGSGVYLALLGLFGLALAFLIRHSAAAITIGIALIFVVGTLMALLPGAWGELVYKLMPGNAGPSAAIVTSFDPRLYDGWTGTGVFAIEVAVLLGIGAVLFQRRDA